ncbi:fungal specific transcription factor [Stagonosporopsis vannaccii]|nr:fungal specific transcription factor [Stagonosporopsis vannaccii]
MKRKDRSTCCSWEGNTSRYQQPSRAEVLRLRRRVAELESQAVPQRDENKIDRNAEVQIDQENVCIHESELADPESHNSNYLHGQNPTTLIPPTFAQGSIGHPPLNEGLLSEHNSIAIQSLSDNKRFFGGPSALSFINQMRTAVQQTLGIQHLTALTYREEFQTHVQGATASGRCKALDYVLPGRRRADKLLSLYWDRVYPLYPFLDKRGFNTQYQGLWVNQENSEDDPVFLCALNLVFAIASQLDEDGSPSERQSSEDVFFQRSKEYLDMWCLNSLHSVQTLLLLSIYLQSSCALDQAWMIIGVAIRAAQSLGLHLGETSGRITSHRERELVRKVWHTCVLLDRMAAMTQGRPSMIAGRIDTKAPFPVSIDEELLPTDDSLPMPTPKQPSILEFFVQSLELFEIFDDVLVQFHSQHPETVYTTEETLDKFLGRAATNNNRCILDIERKLLQWDRSLPSHLKVSHGSLGLDNSPIFTRQAKILRERYLHVRLLSMRPILSAYLISKANGVDSREPEELSLSARIVVQSSVVCVKIAQEMIDLDYSTRPSDAGSIGFTSAWWHNVLYIYSAATVLVAARLSPSILSEIPEESISQSWSRAIDVMKFYQVSNPVIRRYVAALEIICRVIPEHYSHSRHQLPQCQTAAEEAQSMAVQFQADKQGRSRQGSPNAESQCEQTTGSLEDCYVDDLLGSNFDFGINDLSWLNVMPFEV